MIDEQPVRSVAISTGGGDAPGLNAVIRAAVLAADNRGWECWGIRDGYHGILEPAAYSDGGIFRLTRKSVMGISHLGGTILGTTNRGNPFHYPVPQPDGSHVEVDRSDELVSAFLAQNRWFRAILGLSGGRVRDRILQVLVYLAQAAAERRHARMRRDTLNQDERLDTMLSFSGRVE